jgi:hypothetical protein
MTLSPSVTCPSAAMTTRPLRRTQSTVVERMRGRPDACASTTDEEPFPLVDVGDFREKSGIVTVFQYSARGK